MDRSDRSHQRPGQAPVPRFEYRVKGQKLVADPEKSKADVIQIGEIKVPIKDMGKKAMDIEESADVPSQKPIIANDHEAGSSKSAADKYHQPRWCPSGLTHTQKRKLQRLRNIEKKEQEKEKMRDEDFNRYRPMFPQSKVWKVKTADQPARPVGPPQPTSQTSRAYCRASSRIGTARFGYFGRQSPSSSSDSRRRGIGGLLSISGAHQLGDQCGAFIFRLLCGFVGRYGSSSVWAP